MNCNINQSLTFFLTLVICRITTFIKMQFDKLVLRLFCDDCVYIKQPPVICFLVNFFVRTNRNNTREQATSKGVEGLTDYTNGGNHNNQY